MPVYEFWDILVNCRFNPRIIFQFIPNKWFEMAEIAKMVGAAR